MRANKAERKGLRMSYPTVFAAAVGLLVCAGATYGDGATLEFRPVYSSGGSSISGTTIELSEADQYIIFELYARDWNNGPASGFCVEQDGTVSATPCDTIADCNPDPPSFQTCGPGLEVYEMGLNCADWDNGSVPLHTDTSGFACFIFDYSFFCAGVDRSRGDWAFAVSADAGSGCNTTQSCPGGEYGGAYSWDKCGGIRTVGRAPDSQNEGEVYLATYALMVPPGAKGVWTIGPDTVHEPFVFSVNTLFGQNWIDTIIPMTINLPTGRCCDVSGPGAYLGCIDLVTRQECATMSGDPSPWWHEGGSCWGVDEIINDGLDDACSLCESGFDCSDGDACTLDACEDYGGGTAYCVNPDNADLDRDVDCCNPWTSEYTPIDDGDPSTIDTCDQETGQVTHVQVDVVPLLPEDSLGITTCTVDTDCANQAYCVPDSDGGFPGTCYVPKNRYLSVASNPANIVPTARRLTVVTFDRSCGGAGNTSCTTDTQCAGNPEGSTCDDVRIGFQVIGWFGQPNADGYASTVNEASRHYTIWPDLTFPYECGVDDLCPAGSHCDTGLGASNTCRWDADDTEVPSTVVHLSGCHISPKKRDVRPSVGENSAANYYLIEAILEGADITDPSNYTTPLELRTVAVWGDMTGGSSGNVALPPDGAAGFTDILHQVFRFKDKGKGTTAWLDLDPQDPDRNVGFLDMLNAVGGFKDDPYPWDDPCTCAGLAPCN